MKPITNPTEVARYREIASEMMVRESHPGSQFDPAWVRSHRWVVVPGEELGHFSPDQIPVLVRALQKAGFSDCFAVATQSVEPDGIPAYTLSVSERDFESFNTECGLLRYLLTNESRGWAISCTEWYNLFAGPPELVEAMIGQSIERARAEFQEYASLLAGGQNPDESILQTARHYASL